MTKQDHIEDGLQGCEHLDRLLDKLTEKSVSYATGQEESLGAIESVWRDYKKALKRVRKNAVAVAPKGEPKGITHEDKS